MATVTQLAPRIREREVQAALDQAAADRGWPPDPWRLRKPGAKSRPRRREIGNGIADLGPLRVVK